MKYLSQEENKAFEGTGEKNEKGLSLEEFLKAYDPFKYKNPCSTADIAVFASSGTDMQPKQILMIKRKNHPCIGFWALPGGFTEYEEDIDDTARRELAEETGIERKALTQVRTYGNPKRDPRGRLITVLYTTVIDKEQLHPKAGDDAAEARLFDFDIKFLSEKKSGNEKKYEYELNLVCSEEKIKLSARVEKIVTDMSRPECVRYAVISSDKIAFDHAAMIIDAYNALKV